MQKQYKSIRQIPSNGEWQRANGLQKMGNGNWGTLFQISNNRLKATDVSNIDIQIIMNKCECILGCCVNVTTYWNWVIGIWSIISFVFISRHCIHLNRYFELQIDFVTSWHFSVLQLYAWNLNVNESINEWGKIKLFKLYSHIAS